MKSFKCFLLIKEEARHVALRVFQGVLKMVEECLRISGYNCIRKRCLKNGVRVLRNLDAPVLCYLESRSECIEPSRMLVSHIHLSDEIVV